MNKQIVYDAEQSMLPDEKKNCKYCCGIGCRPCNWEGTELSRKINMRVDENYLSSLFKDTCPEVRAPYGSSREQQEQYEKEQAQLPLEEQNCRWCSGTCIRHDEVCFTKIAVACNRCEGTGRMATPMKRQKARRELHELGA